MDEELIDGKKACCRDPANLVLIEKTADSEVWRCQVCQCRHFEVSVAPGSFTTEMKGV